MLIYNLTMICILEFIFSDNTTRSLPYNAREDYGGVSKNLKCEFINSITECEPNSTHKDVHFYDNIKIPFTKQEFNDYLGGKKSIELLNICNFFENTEAITAICSDTKRLELMDIFTRFPFTFDLFFSAEPSLCVDIIKHKNNFYDIRDISLNNAFSGKIFYAMAAIVENSKQHNCDLCSHFILDIPNMIHTFSKENITHSTKIIKVKNNIATEFCVDGLVSGSGCIYNFRDIDTDICVRVDYTLHYDRKSGSIWIKNNCGINATASYYTSQVSEKIEEPNQISVDLVQKHSQIITESIYQFTKEFKSHQIMTNGTNISMPFDNEMLVITCCPKIEK